MDVAGHVEVEVALAGCLPDLLIPTLFGPYEKEGDEEEYDNEHRAQLQLCGAERSRGDLGRKEGSCWHPPKFTDQELLTHLFLACSGVGQGAGTTGRRLGARGQAMKYLALGWWQMMAVVDCSGWS